MLFIDCEIKILTNRTYIGTILFGVIYRRCEFFMSIFHLPTSQFNELLSFVK